MLTRGQLPDGKFRPKDYNEFVITIWQQLKLAEDKTVGVILSLQYLQRVGFSFFFSIDNADQTINYFSCFRKFGERVEQGFSPLVEAPEY